MKGDFTRNTHHPKKHYRDVLLQQGRVLVDADWNEQAALTARRDETTTADIVGNCGGPADNAAFGMVAEISIPLGANAPDQEPIETARAAQAQDLAIFTPRPTLNFSLSAGRYYVDGIQCENEEEVLYTTQPDRFDVRALTANKSYLVYLDVWQRHITALEDGLIREPALGGPDHGTRVKTVWQVYALQLTHGVDLNNPCGSGADEFNQLFDPGTAKLTAGTAAQQAPTDPCLIPASAGYTGLENQLYRVEIHDRGPALDAAINVTGFGKVILPSGNTPKNEIRVTGGPWNPGNIVEIYSAQTGSPKMKGQLARIIAVDPSNPSSLTLNIPVTGWVAADLPRLRRIVGATCKWSRENGSVVTRVERINGNEITVSSLGPDKNLGFAKDAWVEILDDALELESRPGQLAQIDDVDEATRIITLKSAASSLVPAGFSTSTYPNGIVPARNPRIRRWEGISSVKYVGDPATNWLPLESGVQVQFAPNGDYRTGQYWQIPARAATAQSPTGDIEWETDATGSPAALPAFGIKHHLCRLGIVGVTADGLIQATDCRCLWPALTNVPRLFYVSGDGQEAMPDLTDQTGKIYNLPQPLIVGLANAQCLEEPARVMFTVTSGNGLVASHGNLPVANSARISIDAAGLARCDFHLDGTNYSQQVTARLLDANDNPVSLPLIFNANLSKASEVAYDPGKCVALQGKKTVQDAISGLAALTRIDMVAGDGQDTDGGQPVPDQIIVRVSNACGPVEGAIVAFTVFEGFVAKDSTDLVSSTQKTISLPTNGNGIAECRWRTATAPATQQLRAEITGLPAPPQGLPGPAMGAHRLVLFTANLRPGKDCCVTVGQGGDFEDLVVALETLIAQELADICICLLPGDHQVTELLIFPGITPAFNLRHLHIHGCGRASRILLQKHFQVLALSSVTLEDLCIYADDPTSDDHLIALYATQVTIARCHLRQSGARNNWVLVASASFEGAIGNPDGQILIADNLIQSSAQVAIDIFNPEFTVESDAISDAAAQRLASQSKSARARFVKGFRQIVKETPKNDPKKKVLEAALKRITTTRRASKATAPVSAETSIASEDVTPQSLADDLIVPMPTRLIQTPALVIATADAETAIVDNLITGEVRIYGISLAFTDAQFNSRVASVFPKGEFFVTNPSHSLRIEGNSLTKVVTASEMEGNITPFQGGAAGSATGLFARMSILDNTFSSAGNQWLAAHVISNGNHFIQPSQGPNLIHLGATAAATFICVGTSCNLPAHLEYGVAFSLSGIATFRESANNIILTEIV